MNNMGGVKMKRLKDVILYVLVLLISFVSCKNDSDDPVEKLKKRIDNAEMVEYIDSAHGTKLLYPDFFLVDTTREIEYVRFYYTDENVKELSLNLSYYPPRFFENINKVVEIYENSPAEKAGLKKDDIIIKVDGIDAKENGVNRIPIGWQTGSTNYLVLRNASSGNSTIKLTTVGSPGSTIEYSSDGSTWNTLTSSKVTVSVNQAIYLRGTNSYISRDASNYQQFVMTGWFEVSGPLSALLDGTGMTVPRLKTVL